MQRSLRSPKITWWQVRDFIGLVTLSGSMGSWKISNAQLWVCLWWHFHRQLDHNGSNLIHEIIPCWIHNTTAYWDSVEETVTGICPYLSLAPTWMPFLFPFYHGVKKLLCIGPRGSDILSKHMDSDTITRINLPFLKYFGPSDEKVTKVTVQGSHQPKQPI